MEEGALEALGFSSLLHFVREIRRLLLIYHDN